MTIRHYFPFERTRFRKVVTRKYYCNKKYRFPRREWNISCKYIRCIKHCTCVRREKFPSKRILFGKIKNVGKFQYVKHVRMHKCNFFIKNMSKRNQIADVCRIDGRRFWNMKSSLCYGSKFCRNVSRGCFPVYIILYVLKWGLCIYDNTTEIAIWNF